MSKKITALPQASSPLIGNEVFALVQNGTTVKAAVSSLSGGGSGSLPSNVAFTNISNNFTTSQSITGNLNVTVVTLSSNSINPILLKGDYNSNIKLGTGNNELIGATNMFFGVGTGQYQTGSYNLIMGANAGTNNSGNYNTFLGKYAGRDQTGNFNIALGEYSCAYNTGNNNFFGGRNSGRNNTGSNNIFIGYNAGRVAQTSNNVFIGERSGSSTTTGIFNVFLGNRSGRYNTTGRYNVFLGSNAGQQNTTGYDNTFVGHEVGQSMLSGTSNTFIGKSAGLANIGGKYNTFIGKHSGLFSSGSGNTFVGCNVTPDIVNPALSSCIGIGTSVEITASNQFALGSTQYPLLTTASAATPATATAFLMIRLNGQNLKIPLYT